MNRNAVTCPPCGENVGLPTKRGGYKGFTLIELLVVVLIIGILAAVAVPQYTKAVEKSRTREAVLVLRNMQRALKLCYLQYGDRAVECEDNEQGFFSRMDIEIPGTKLESSFCDSSTTGCYLTKDWLYDFDGLALYAWRVTNLDDLLNGPYHLMANGPEDRIYCEEMKDGGCKNVCGANPCTLQ